MSVKIRIKGNQGTNEYKDAIALKEIFENEFRNKSINGEILIISNATLFGQDTKDVDLIVIGKFEKYSIKVKTKAKIKDKEFKQEERLLFISDFCFVIETKGHPAENIQLDGLILKVKYNEKYHDVTTQSENQKFALKKYFEDRLNFSPYICNFIWLRNVSTNSIKELLGNNPDILDKHNYLPTTFSVRWLFQLACIQKTPRLPFDKNTLEPKRYCVFESLMYNQKYDFSEIDRIFDLFAKVKQVMGDLTRKKIEHITRDILKDQKYAQAIGKKLVIISGRAGTGKTIKLLTIACDLAVNNGARCLILTYNLALVSDIKRTLALAELPDGVDDYSVRISTLHKFFYEVLCGFEIGTSRSINGKVFIYDYIDRYKELLEELYTYIENELIGEVELQSLMKSRHEQVAWDYILIDEAQDWNDIEKKLIYFMFGKEKVIIADGVDQLIRSQKKCNWTQGLKKDVDFHKTSEKKGLRQKAVLVSFVKEIAENLNVYWDLEPKEDLYGGKIIIKIGDYTKDLHDREFAICKNFGNSAYEMMFLVPPSLVYRGINGRAFSKTQEFSNKGIKIWDGTKSDLRTEYSVDLESHRLLQYESCRGLEGWTVVCLELDEFMRYKFETFEEEDTGELALETFEEKRDKFVNLWSLIPLTRAIDTLIITIKNPESKIASVLREIYMKNPDKVEWIE
ncbi:MAG: AAA family ATPase [Bacteroidetes bacterium]|nr:AAA family ATPase [Bacteroidota bacterium]